MDTGGYTLRERPEVANEPAESETERGRGVSGILFSLPRLFFSLKQPRSLWRVFFGPAVSSDMRMCYGELFRSWFDGSHGVCSRVAQCQQENFQARAHLMTYGITCEGRAMRRAILRGQSNLKMEPVYS